MRAVRSWPKSCEVSAHEEGHSGVTGRRTALGHLQSSIHLLPLTSGHWGLTWQCHTTSLLPQPTNASFQFPPYDGSRILSATKLPLLSPLTRCQR